MGKQVFCLGIVAHCSVVMAELKRACLKKACLSPSIFILCVFAVAGNDYQGVSTTLRLQRCVTRTCITVSVVNDVRMEAVRETFTLVLENTNQDSRIRVSTQPSTVYITDNDGLYPDYDQVVVTECCGDLANLHRCDD